MELFSHKRSFLIDFTIQLRNILMFSYNMNFQPTIDFTSVFTKVARKFIIRINIRVK